MSVKVKMRCARCGKSFKSAGAKQTLCPECEVKARNERAASKVAGPKVATPHPAQTQAPKIVGPGASILVPGLVTTEDPAPADTGAFGHRHPDRGGSGTANEPRGRSGVATQPQHSAHGPAAHASAPRSSHGGQVAHEKLQRPAPARHDVQKPQPKAQKAPAQPRPATPPMELTDELRQKIEQRYLELADPVEFDGIRTQIAGELRVPKALVKKAVLELRARTQMPSWWELQSYTGGNTDLERIRRAYMPLLPVPEIGVHKTIAAELGLDPSVVYQAIKRIRAEMRLPRYNPPELHEGEKADSEKAVPSEDQRIATGPSEAEAHEQSVEAE